MLTGQKARILFESSSDSAPETYQITLEDDSGSILLESGDYLLLEGAP